MSRQPRKQSAFTLVEFTLVLTLFGLTSVLGYQALISTVKSKNKIVVEAQNRQQLSAAHRTLRHAFSAHGELTGDAHTLTVTLDAGDASWLNGRERITFKTESSGALTATMSGRYGQSVLLTALEKPTFRYFKGADVLATVDKSSQPDLVEISWLAMDGQQRWKFRVK